MRVRSSDTPTTRTHHHATEPSSTPITTSEGRRNEPPVPSPSVAASAAKDTIVAGLVIVSPRVDAYAHATPRPLLAFVAVASRRRAIRTVTSSPYRIASPTTTNGRRPAANAVVSAVTPSVAIAA